MRRTQDEPAGRSRFGFRAAWIVALAAPFAAALALAVAAAITIADVAVAQETKPAIAPIEQRVDAFIAQVEARRQAIGVVGAAIVVVEGDKVVRTAVFGQRQADPALPVTENTLFMMASATKQFTGMAVALAVGEGKVSLADHPRRFVPGFTLKDAESDAKLTILDLLTHRTGIERSDAAFLLLPFTQTELFALAQRATPAAKLGERFIYNNTMFSLAGAAVAGAYGTTYERFMRERILAPLGMKASTFSYPDFVANADRAHGYAGTTAADRKSADLADPTAIAPAGGLYSNVHDLAAWLRFLNAGGQTAALRVAPAAYAEMFKGHIAVGDGSAYALGFQVRAREGMTEVEHGGNLPGFTAQIVHVPERGLSMALLTNQSYSGLAGDAKELFWDVVVSPKAPAAKTPEPEKPNPTPPANVAAIAAEKLPGAYFGYAGASFDIRASGTDFTIQLPGVPLLPMSPAGTNTYNIEASGGYQIRFVEWPTLPGRIVALIFKPGESIIAIRGMKRDTAWLARARAEHAGPNAALIGSYRSADRKVTVEIVPHRGGVGLNIPGEDPLLFVEAGKDSFRLEGRPETERVEISRDGGGKVNSIALADTSGRKVLVAEDAGGDPAAARDILTRATAEAGGEALDRITSMVAAGVARAPLHGFEGPAEETIVPGKRAGVVKIGGFEKFLTIRSAISDRGGWATFNDGERAPIEGKALAVMRVFAVPHPLYRWQQRFASVSLAGEEMVNGEAAHVIEAKPADLAPAKIFISKQTLRVVRVEMPDYVGDEAQSSSTVDYSDHRAVSGVTLPFASSVSMPIMGTMTLVIAYERVTLDAPVDPKVFD